MSVIKRIKKIDYRELALEVQKKTGKLYHHAYIRNVHHGIQQGDKLLLVIEEILKTAK